MPTHSPSISDPLRSVSDDVRFARVFLSHAIGSIRYAACITVREILAAHPDSLQPILDAKIIPLLVSMLWENDERILTKAEAMDAVSDILSEYFTGSQLKDVLTQICTTIILHEMFKPRPILKRISFCCEIVERILEVEDIGNQLQDIEVIMKIEMQSHLADTVLKVTFSSEEIHSVYEHAREMLNMVNDAPEMPSQEANAQHLAADIISQEHDAQGVLQENDSAQANSACEMLNQGNDTVQANVAQEVSKANDIAQANDA